LGIEFKEEYRNIWVIFSISHLL